MPIKVRNPLLRAGSLEELCEWRGADFVRCAYVTILGRQPDAGGEAYYLARLRSGFSKLTLIAQMRRSAEGRHHDPGIAGLDKALRKHRNACRPLVGPVVRWLTGRTGDSFRERQSRILADLVAGVDRLLQRQSGTEARIGEFQTSIGNRIGLELTTLSERLLRQHTDGGEMLQQRIVALQSSIEDKIGHLELDMIDRARKVEHATSQILDTQRTTAEMILKLSSTVDDLGSSQLAIDARLDALGLNAERVRGLMLKANQNGFGYNS